MLKVVQAEMVICGKSGYAVRLAKAREAVALERLQSYAFDTAVRSIQLLAVQHGEASNYAAA